MIKMRDGRYLRCVYNHTKGGYPPDYISHPAIVLKLEDGSDILLPIIVCKFQKNKKNGFSNTHGAILRRILLHLCHFFDVELAELLFQWKCQVLY